MKKQSQQIELRSEKVRNIIGQIPPVMLRYGILIISLALCVLIGVSAVIPYQPIIHSDLEIKQKKTGQLYFTMNIRKKDMKRKEKFAEIVCKRATELSLPYRYQIHTILDTLLLDKESTWYQAVLIPTELVLPNIKLNIDSLTLPAEIIMKKKSILMWVLEKKNMQ